MVPWDSIGYTNIGVNRYDFEKACANIGIT